MTEHARDRRSFLKTVGLGSLGAAAGGMFAAAAAQSPDAKTLAAGAAAADAKPAYFRLAIAGLLRHKRLVEVAADIARYRSKGYNAVYVENDYLRWSFEPDADAGFFGDWRMFNLFDFTRGRDRGQCGDYLRRLCRMCGDARLDVYLSFWLPQLTTEFRQYLRSEHTDAIGRTSGEGQSASRPSARARTARAWRSWAS